MDAAKAQAATGLPYVDRTSQSDVGDEDIRRGRDPTMSGDSILEDDVKLELHRKYERPR